MSPGVAFTKAELLSNSPFLGSSANGMIGMIMFPRFQSVTNMKYSLIVIFLIIASATTTHAQQLLDELMGKWNVKEYHNNGKTAIDTGFIEFQQNGVFESRGSYFGSRRGLYRTDETRSVVLFDNGKTSEWKAHLTNNILKLNQIGRRPRKSKIFLILVKEGKDENQQVIN